VTPKQEAFCLAYVETGNASDAYRRVYDAARMKPGTVNRKAKELLDNGKITARIDELRSELVKLNLWTREQSVRALIDVVHNPDRQADVIAAVRELNAMHGFNAPDKLEVSGPGGGPIPARIVIDWGDDG